LGCDPYLPRGSSWLVNNRYKFPAFGLILTASVGDAYSAEKCIDSSFLLGRFEQF
jgi:hypothetical protein